MSETVPVHIIARIRSQFPEKFGIPRQSGLVEELKARVVFEPEYRDPQALRGWRGSPISGSSGSSPGPWGRAGLPRCGRPVWGATSAWGSLLPGPPSGPIPWACPA